MGTLSIVLFLEHSPPLYHAYVAMTVFLWTKILSERQFLRSVWRHLSGSKFSSTVKLLATGAVSVLILELLVMPSVIFSNILPIATLNIGRLCFACFTKFLLHAGE